MPAQADPPAAHAPFVTVICPVRNEAATVGAVLAGLLAGDYPAEQMEVLVVDGGSSDGTQEIVARISEGDSRIRALPNAAGSAAAGLNVGLAEAGGEVVVRLDGHAFPAPNYVRECVDALRRTGAWVVGGPLVGVGSTPFGRAVAAAMSTWLGSGGATYRSAAEGPVDTVYLGAWPRWVFDRVGPFDETLFRNQDYEMCLRIRGAGGTVWLDPRIRTRTLMRPGPLALARQYFQYGSGRAATVAKHPGSLLPRQAAPAAAVAAGAALLASAPRSRSAGQALAGLSGLYGAAIVASAARAARRDDAVSLPVAASVYPIAHVAWGTGFLVGCARQALRRRE